ncbi:FadR/GntR family transcriptional regulator [Terriglobus saanensis]|uniref:GntR domain protein n=1 Tax=Terriglobus saanensis (strain ATCC BAA-1853 / DSM 23119 / SP1PR4) TaxID=401053 RepID=E8V1S5_TERSS|nr:FadR/GntR family transcriptional regulator [Terriglobus saanensis]ADV82356.1 GntR domain protein [Terriglobus saanensis SP1PR4]
MRKQNAPDTTLQEKTALKTRPVQKNSISDEIVQQIMKQISSGSLRPGQRLPSERELCKQFNAGRSSLREALRCLSIMGVLTARVGEGTSVATDGSKFLNTIMKWRVITERYDVRDLMEVRLAMEGLSAASAAERATDAELAAISEFVVRMHDAVGDAKRFSSLDLEFHLAISRASKNLAMVDMLTMIRSQLPRVVSTVLKLPDARPLSLKEHETIIKALLKRDPEGARKAMQVHLSSAIKRYDSTQPKVMY